jgi:Protein of unknown function with HXXEE motif
MRVSWLAPPIFLLHFLEEGPRFLAWINSRVDPDLSYGWFLGLNGTALLATTALAATAAHSRSRGAALAFLCWASFLMLANGLLHLGATVYFGEYCPGSISAALLYLPYFAWLFATVGGNLKERGAVTLAGAAPMLAQGYAVLFEGTRLLW